MLRPTSFVFICTLLLLAGCSRDKSRNEFVARVGKTELTADELAAARDSVAGVRAHPEQFVNDWIINELLFQEANKRGMSESDQVRRQLDAARKRLVIEALLDKEVYSIDTSAVSEDSVRAIYASAPQSIALKEDVVHASFALFGDRDQANNFRALLVKRSPWNDAVDKMTSDSTTRAELLQVATRQYFTQTTLYPEELWKLARTLARDEVSFVVHANAGYYVLVVHGIRRQGEQPEYDYARNEIRQRLVVAMRRDRYERLVADLRAKQSIELRLGQMQNLPAAGE